MRLRRPAPVAAKPSVTDVIRTCTGRDGASIAYAASGDGFPLVKAPNWMTNLEHDWTSPSTATGSPKLRAIQPASFGSDMRGFGMSELGAARFHLRVDGRRPWRRWSTSRASSDATCSAFATARAIAMAYAARHPERVRKLILVNSFAAGWRVRADPEEIAWRESLLEMNRRHPSFPPQPARRDVHHALFPVGQTGS